MDLTYHIRHLHKRIPLQIARGIMTGADNLFVALHHEDITGWGEMAPGVSEGAGTAEAGQAALKTFAQNDLSKLSIHEVYALAWRQALPACALAALDMALWDWLGKKAKMPLYRVLGLGKKMVPTSVTIGINTPEVAFERARTLLGNAEILSLKVKLGSANGVATDQAMFSAVVEATQGRDVVLRVDANGGWDLAGARMMMKWLAERGVEYIEQPLARGENTQLEELYQGRALPIFVDESCHVSADIPKLAPVVDGVNLKLNKCGGITEALRIVATARAHGLQTMIGCMGESSLSISAGAALGSLFDHIDLDSNLNLDPDPATGVKFIDGTLQLTEEPGHGGRLKDVE